MKKEIDKLYHPLIIQHNNEPVSFVKREDASQVLEAYNPLCGDRFKLYFEIENGVISNLSFYGFGCAVAKASTSVLIENLNQQLKRDSIILVDSFLSMFEDDNKAKSVLEMKDFLPFKAAKDFPGRIKCATLAWNELQQFLLKL